MALKLRETDDWFSVLITGYMVERQDAPGYRFANVSSDKGEQNAN
jgi:hypothetical protein